MKLCLYTLYQCLCKRSVSVIVGDGCERKPEQWLPDRAGQGKICKCSCYTSHWHRVHVWGKRHCFLLPGGLVVESGFAAAGVPRAGPRPRALEEPVFWPVHAVLGCRRRRPMRTTKLSLPTGFWSFWALLYSKNSERNFSSSKGFETRKCLFRARFRVRNKKSCFGGQGSKLHLRAHL